MNANCQSGATEQASFRRVTSSLNYRKKVEGTKRDLILRAFEDAEQKHTVAARLLGVHPNYVHRLVRNFDLGRGGRGALSVRGDMIKT